MCDWSIMEFGPEQFGKWLVGIGLLMAAVGALFILLGKLGIFRLPGDIEFGGHNWKVYMPLASCIIISIVLTLILWLINYLRR
jgi:hypothetical protein